MALNTYLVYYLVAPLGVYLVAIVLAAYGGYHLYLVPLRCGQLASQERLTDKKMMSKKGIEHDFDFVKRRIILATNPI